MIGDDVMVLVYGLIVLFLLILIYLIVIIFAPILKVEFQPIEIAKEPSIAPENRENVTFKVNGLNVSGWFYGVEGVSSCIVMSHGFNGTKDMELEKYALKFNQNGYSVLTYDYRFYGSSEGEPRQLYSGPSQLEDLKAAISYARSREDVHDIILWGTSAAASYGLVIASEDHDITAVIAQCGAYDHKVDSKLYTKDLGMGFFLKLFVHGQRDKGRSRFGLSAHKYPAYGKAGSIAMISREGAVEGITLLAKNSTTFVNETCARLALMPHIKDPIKASKDVNCPVMLLVCEEDNLVSPISHVRLLENLKEPILKKYPVGHFEIYMGKWYEMATDDMIQFLDGVNGE